MQAILPVPRSAGRRGAARSHRSARQCPGLDPVQPAASSVAAGVVTTLGTATVAATFARLPFVAPFVAAACPLPLPLLADECVLTLAVLGISASRAMPDSAPACWMIWANAPVTPSAPF